MERFSSLCWGACAPWLTAIWKSLKSTPSFTWLSGSCASSLARYRGPASFVSGTCSSVKVRHKQMWLNVACLAIKCKKKFFFLNISIYSEVVLLLLWLKHCRTDPKFWSLPLLGILTKGHWDIHREVFCCTVMPMWPIKASLFFIFAHVNRESSFSAWA